MRFSNDGRTWSDWEGFQSTRSWDLTRFGGSSSYGLKTVYAQLRDRAGNVSQTFSATIRFTFFTGTLSGHTDWVFRGVQPRRAAAGLRLLRALRQVEAVSKARSSCGMWPVAEKCAPSQATPTGSIPWRSAPTGGCWPLAPMTRRSSCGMWPVAEKCAPSQATPTGSLPWRSAPTGGSWPPAPAGVTNQVEAVTRRSSCGMWPVAEKCAPSQATPAMSFPWRSAPTGGSWPPAAAEAPASCAHKARSSCGMWPVAASCAPSLATPTGVFRGVQPRRAAPGIWLRDNTIKLWDVASGSLVRTLTGHTGWVNSVAFSPDGRLLASGSDDKTIKLWDVASGREVRTPHRPHRLGLPWRSAPTGGCWPPAPMTGRSSCGTSAIWWGGETSP
jgi:hypothetical protein